MSERKGSTTDQHVAGGAAVGAAGSERRAAKVQARSTWWAGWGVPGRKVGEAPRLLPRTVEGLRRNRQGGWHEGRGGANLII